MGLVVIGVANAEIKVLEVTNAADYTNTSGVQFEIPANGGLAAVYCTGLTGSPGTIPATGYPLSAELAGISANFGRLYRLDRGETERTIRSDRGPIRPWNRPTLFGCEWLWDCAARLRLFAHNEQLSGAPRRIGDRLCHWTRCSRQATADGLPATPKSVVRNLRTGRRGTSGNNNPSALRRPCARTGGRQSD
jgi:hypothetical protein